MADAMVKIKKGLTQYRPCTKNGNITVFFVAFLIVKFKML